MRCLLLLGLILATGCDDDVAQGGMDMAVAVDAAEDLSGQPPEDMAGMMSDAMQMMPDDGGTPHDFAGVDLTGGCQTVTCTPGPVGNALCKAACMTANAACAGGNCMP